MTTTKRPVALIILDGFGHNPDEHGNAVAAAAKPNWDRLCARGPSTLIHTSGEHVGLPDGQMGNSEVGHLNIGAGRVVYQDYTRISKAVDDGSLFENRVLIDAMEGCAASNRTLHFLGLLSPGGVHSHEHHLYALIRMAKARGVTSLAIHAMLDGRDMPPKSAAPSIKRLEALLAEEGVGHIASIAGRFYAMDRDNRWERIEKAYRLYTEGHAQFEATHALDALDAAYARGETDEFVTPTRIADAPPIDDGDAVIFWNYRADRVRQITRAFIEPQFDGFDAHRFVALRRYVCLTEYHADFDAPVAFAPLALPNVFGAAVAEHGKTQLRIAETEKYPHVTFFFNGGEEAPFAGEDRILVPSPKVRTYDLQPEMSAPEVTEKLVEAIKSGRYDAIICNYANPDMVGHCGDFDAAVKAVEAVDEGLGAVTAAMDAAGGVMLVTADHGNAEQMVHPETGEPQTAHTTFPVPLVLHGRDGTLRDGGILADIAPTLLHLMGLEPPGDMSGRSLLG